MAAFLPQEVVSHILRFLDLPDRKSAALVCQNWYQASLDFVLLSDIVTAFQCWSDFDAALPLLGKRCRLNLTLENIDNSLATRDKIACLDRDIGRRIRCLSLAGCDLTEALFTSLLSNCTGLEKLNISRCNSLFMTGQLLSKSTDVELLRESLAGLQQLNIASIRYISDLAFNRLLSVCPSIKNLSLAGNQIVFHTNKYLWKGQASDGPTSTVLTFDNITSFLIANATQITGLDFSRTAINDDALSLLGRIPGLQLKKFHISLCQELTDSGITALCKTQPSLELLDLTDSQMIRDSSLESICAECDNLCVLRLGKCRQITDLSVCKLKCLRNLQRLDLTACYSATSRGLSLGLCSAISPMRRLTSLNLACCSSVGDSFIVELTSCVPGLMELDISSCNISNVGLRAISARLVHLRQLRLAWCQDITDAGLLGAPDTDVSLPYNDRDEPCKCTRRQQSLNIFNPPKPLSKKKTTVKSEYDLAEADFQPIMNLKSLQLLDLTSCHRITDASISEVMSFIELRSLHLSLCPKLTDVSLVAIASGLPSLEELHLAQLPGISDGGIVPLTERLSRLSFLDVSSCDGLTDCTIDALALNAKTLRRLDVSLCSGISSEAVDKLENRRGYFLSVQRRHIGLKTEASTGLNFLAQPGPARSLGGPLAPFNFPGPARRGPFGLRPGPFA